MTRIIPIKKVREKDIIKAIKQGKIIIYPTDTIYDIGCDALNTEAVLKIRKIKEREEEKPFSIIAQSKQWIYKNFEVNKSYIEKLPGPFTFILRTKKEKLVSNHVTNNQNILGIRIPDHKFTKIIQKAKTPFITTSANISGQQPANEIKKVPKKITSQVDLIIDAGQLTNRPSTVIDLTGNIPRIIFR